MPVKLFFFFTILLVCFALNPDGLRAQISLSGFTGNYNAITFQPPHELIAGRNRVRLNFRNDFSDARIYLSAGLAHQYAHAADSLDFRFREAYFDLFLENVDIRVGKQVTAWGKTDGGFIMDVISPFDLSEFTTQQFTELREGVTALSYARFFGRNTLQVLVNPVFEPSRLPAYTGRWSAVPTDFFPVPTTFEVYERDSSTIRDVQGAVRFAWRPSFSFDVDVAALYWRNRLPGYFKEFDVIDLFWFKVPEAVTFTETYKTGLILGGWGEYRVSNNLALLFEAGWHQKKPFDILPENISGSDFDLLENLDFENIDPSQVPELLDLIQRFTMAIDEYGGAGFLDYRPAFSWMAGLRLGLDGWTVGAQFTAEHILRHDPEIVQEPFFGGLTLTLTKPFLRDKLLARFLGRYHLNGNDIWLNPEASYSIRDGLVVSAGAHVFGREKPDRIYGHPSYYRYRNNSFGFISMTFYW